MDIDLNFRPKRIKTIFQLSKKDLCKIDGEPNRVFYRRKSSMTSHATVPFKRGKQYMVTSSGELLDCFLLCLLPFLSGLLTSLPAMDSLKQQPLAEHFVPSLDSRFLLLARTNNIKRMSRPANDFNS